MSHSPDDNAGTERALRSSTRNPRRRQRQTDPESVKSAPRRKRSKISENTFVPPRYDELDEPIMEEVARVNGTGTTEIDLVNGDTPETSTTGGRGRPRKESHAGLEMDIPLRSKRTSVRRSRGDGSTTLTQTERYSLKLLPSTPKDLRKADTEWRGSIGVGHLALAITRTRAYIWDYTAHSPVTNPKVFELPFVTKTSDPLPFATFVSTGANTETGLLIVSASTGKVVFYESVERAASLGLFQDRNVGVEGPLGSLFSGETVSDVISVHHAGFILPLTSGRIAHVTLRDAQGKGHVSAQFLRAADPQSGGFFGSIKGLLGTGAWKRDVAAVRARQLGPRAKMQALSLTEKAELQTWDLEWNGQYNFRGTLDLRDVVVEEMKKLDAPELQGKYEHLRAHDFAILEKSQPQLNEVATVGTGLPLHILVLLQAGRDDDCEHIIADLVVEGEGVRIPQLLQLHTYHKGSIGEASGKPRLILPSPGNTAVAVFPDAFVIKELDQTDANSPGEQLQASLVQPALFEDAIYLKHDRALAIFEACEETDKSENESAVAFVNGAGLVRLTVTIPPPDDDRQQRIPIKSKIEQAVFHGALQDGNILDFSRTSDNMYMPAEVEEAALSVSDEILRSTSAFISNTPTSMEPYLSYKARALRALVVHVRQSYPPLSASAMWHLLWDAEKVAAAQELWKLFEEHVATSDQTKRISLLMNDACMFANKDIGGDANQGGSDDAVRLFLIHNLQRLDKLLTWAEEVLRELKAAAETTAEAKMRLVNEADGIWNHALETVFSFRTENASTYGISGLAIEDGILVDVDEYVDLPEFWTSTAAMLKAIVRMAELSRQIANEEFEKVGHDAESPLAPWISLIGAHNPRLIESMCAIYQERINWSASRPSERDRELAELLQIKFNEARHNNIRELADIAQAEAGMRLAEKYRDMHTLTEMVVAEMQFSIDSLRITPDSERADIDTYISKLTARVSSYFERYGNAWANAYFDEGFSSSHAGVMLREAQERWQKSLTRYLRAEESRAKICWINDITSETDFWRASACLLCAAQDQAIKTWEKKVELSMGKLCLLATREDRAERGTPLGMPDLEDWSPKGDLQIADIQDRLYQHLLSEVDQCIDHQAEVEVAMQKFAFKNQDLHALKQLLESYLDRALDLLVLSADELIDVLTLLDNVITDPPDPSNLQGSEFFLALRVLNAMAPRIPAKRFDTLLQLIWKRCYVYDNWHDINRGQKQSDEAIAEQVQGTATWRTLYYAMSEGFFEAADCHVRFVAPSECVGAGCRAEELTYRWPDGELLDPILKDNRIQGEQLQSYVDDRRLDEWIDTCVEDVKRTLEEKADADAERLAEERDVEALASRGELGGEGNKVNGHGLNGTANGGLYHGDSVLGTAVRVDGDGDVDMV